MLPDQGDSKWVRHRIQQLGKRTLCVLFKTHSLTSVRSAFVQSQETQFVHLPPLSIFLLHCTENVDLGDFQSDTVPVVFN